MDSTRERDQIFADYGACLALAVPTALTARCFDARGQLFWSTDWRDSSGSPASPETSLDPRTEQGLRQVLANPGSGEAESFADSEVATWFFPLHTQRDRLHGVLVLQTTAGDLQYSACAGAVGPVTRTLQRELDLRMRLLDGQRKQAVQTSEEKLLHHVESLAHKNKPARAKLERILELVREYLKVERAALVVPGEDIRMLDAEGLSGPEAELALESMIVKAEALSESSAPEQDEADLVRVPVTLPHGSGDGTLALSGWASSKFSAGRRRRIARFIGSHVESIIEREFDPLTGLMAFANFESSLEAACAGAQSEEYTLLYLDIDQIHVINDNYGREVGDEVLMTFASLLRNWFSGHLVTRISSDSFAALVAGMSRPQAQRLAEVASRRLAEMEFSGAGKSFKASVSIGVAPLASGDQAAGGSLSAAQAACRTAKDRGAGSVAVYDVADQSVVKRIDDIHLVGRVREAIEDGRLVLLGQPIRSLRGQPSDSLEYLEVLVRMIDDAGNQLPPGEFLSAAERYQLMDELDRRVVRLTLEMLAKVAANETAARPRIAINLSGQSLGNEKFLHYVTKEIERTGVDPKRLCFEITETVAVANMQRAQALMSALKKMGCKFSLDDFGTGLSSFAYLKLFPVGTIKIDGSFVRDIHTNVVSQSVVAAISEVARVMGLETVAEFVEDERAMSLLKDLGVTWGQGYLLGEPQPLETLLNAHSLPVVAEADTA